MQLQLFLFLTVLENGKVLSLQFEEGCEARSMWRIPYKWNEYDIGFWVPPADEESTDILTIDLHFKGHVFPVTYDSIQVLRNGTVFERAREGNRIRREYFNPFTYPEGWNRLIFTIEEHIGVLYEDNDVFNTSVEYIPEFLEIEGSNVTVGCHSDVRIWKISDTPTSLPLTKAEQHWISFYSTKKFLPVIDLQMRKFLLGWDEGELTTIPAKAQSLPPFTIHLLKLSCIWSANAICIVMIGENESISEKLIIGDQPKTVTISRGRSEGDFYVFLRYINKFNHTQMLDDITDSSFRISKVIITEIVLLILLILIFFVNVLMIKRTKAAQLKHKNVSFSWKTKAVDEKVSENGVTIPLEIRR